jgi:hypothetical protein
MEAASYTIKEQLLSEALVLLDKRELRICVLYRRDPYPRTPYSVDVRCAKITTHNPRLDPVIRVRICAFKRDSPYFSISNNTVRAAKA